MGKSDTKDLVKFLKPFSPEIRKIALWLREFVWDLYPNSNELIYDNYNAVAFGWSPTDKVGDTFCSVAVGSNKYVHFGFYWGSKIADQKKILLGNGNQYRFIRIKTETDLPKVYIKKLMRDAYAYSVAKMKIAKEEAAKKSPRKTKSKEPVFKGTTIIKSISPVKKRPK